MALNVTIHITQAEAEALHAHGYETEGLHFEFDPQDAMTIIGKFDLENESHAVHRLKGRLASIYGRFAASVAKEPEPTVEQVFAPAPEPQVEDEQPSEEPASEPQHEEPAAVSEEHIEAEDSEDALAAPARRGRRTKV